jgi:putative lipoic acid-binding regulatory protein
VSEQPPAGPPGEQLLQFPTDYPIKIVGRPSAEFRARIHAVVLKHVPNVETDRISERLSENGNFLSISYTIVAESRVQVEGLARDLVATEGVLMVI